jgi:hypothetical protein
MICNLEFNQIEAVLKFQVDGNVMKLERDRLLISHGVSTAIAVGPIHLVHGGITFGSN